MILSTSLLELVGSPERLHDAWENVQRRQEEDTSLAVKRFRKDADAKLAELSTSILNQEYVPSDLTQLLIPKHAGGWRTLDVPAVRDRIVEHAVLDVVTPFVDCHLSAAAYAYRPGLGVIDAVQRIVECREAGQSWALRSDVYECFPNLPRELALGMLLPLLPDSSLESLISQFVYRRTKTKLGRREVPGIPQGTSLSPLLCNLVLTIMDNAVMDAGYQIVRYADDFTILCDSEYEIRKAKKVAEKAAASLGMKLGDSKTEIMDFNEGFCFLGEDFGSKYPPLLPEHRVEAATNRILFVGRQGSRVRVKNGRIFVTSKADVTLLEIPSSHISRLVLFGAVGLSAGARTWLLAQGAETIFLSRKGNYLGAEIPASASPRASRLRAQLGVSSERKLSLAKEIIASKLRHQITLIQRFNKPATAEAVGDDLAMIRNMLHMVPDAQEVNELMGLEGAAAKAYFDALALLVPEEMKFAGRSRRPPLDVFNAALGYGYAILQGECFAALMSVGLEPNIGMLHSDQDKRPSLALDLMEEFRPYVVDQVVLKMCRSGTLKSTHGRCQEGVAGVLLTKAGKEALVDAYEHRQLQVTRGALPGFSGSIRRHLYRQAQRMAIYLLQADTTWTGLSWR